MKYKRGHPIDCKPAGAATEAWFYVNDGSIVIVCGGSGGQAILRRDQLKAALAAMRPVRKRP